MGNFKLNGMVAGIYLDKSAEEYSTDVSAKSAALSGKLGIAISVLVRFSIIS